MENSIINSISTFSKPQSGAVVVFYEGQAQIHADVAALVDGDLIARTARAYDFDGKKFKSCETIVLQEQGFEQLVLIGAKDVEKFDGDDWLKLGGATAAALVDVKQVTIAFKFASLTPTIAQLADFITGLSLRFYKFDKYQTKKREEKKNPPAINLAVDNVAMAEQALNQAQILKQAVILARDLVNEPANILGTVEFADEIKKLEKYGLTIEILGRQELEQAKMGALLGVAQGSARPPRLAIMRWNGGKAEKPPLAFIGKGVVFDTGGISLKPGAGMEDMKGDMGGAAAVTGAMLALAARKARVNAVGLVGLVENMPDGTAQRPGDIVTSMSGQTIEVINTDAEGRLVLADVLWYARTRFKPQFMVNFATLTGAIMVALGKYHAGLFSNNDDLAKNLYATGLATGERVWRMPLSEDYDKIVDSKVADMRNSTGRLAGSICAAQFLQRFVGDTPWAHLDIAGTAMDAPFHEYNQSWGSGFGVRLVDRLVADYYEA